jgi:hypothetical protein
MIRGRIQAGRRKVGGRSETGRRQVGGISLKRTSEWNAESGIQDIRFKKFGIHIVQKNYKKYYRITRQFLSCKDIKKS